MTCLVHWGFLVSSPQLALDANELIHRDFERSSTQGLNRYVNELEGPCTSEHSSECLPDTWLSSLFNARSRQVDVVQR